MKCLSWAHLGGRALSDALGISTDGVSVPQCQPRAHATRGLQALCLQSVAQEVSEAS